MLRFCASSGASACNKFCELELNKNTTCVLKFQNSYSKLLEIPVFENDAQRNQNKNPTLLDDISSLEKFLKVPFLL